MVKGRSSFEVDLDPVNNRTGDVWHIMLPGVRPDLLYGEHILVLQLGHHHAYDHIQSIMGCVRRMAAGVRGFVMLTLRRCYWGLCGWQLRESVPIRDMPCMQCV